MQLRRTHYINLAQYAIVFIPCIVYFYFVNKFALNLPSQDDYVAILDFLSRWSQAHGWDKFFTLFDLHNEHRILSSRLVYVLYYKVTGGVNFRHLIFIGNAQLIGILLIIVHFHRRLLPKYWFLASFIASLALFDLNNWENTCFAMACMQNFGIVFLFVLSLFLYSLNGGFFTVAAVLAQILCTYSSGNGMVASAFIVLFNLLHKNTGKKYVSIAALVIFAPLYFLHYAPTPSGHSSANMPEIVMYVFTFIANHIYYSNRIIAVTVGVCLSVCLAYTILNKRSFSDGKLLPFTCIAGFMLATIALTSFFRSNPDCYIASRYLIYTHLLTGMLFTFLLVKLEGKRMLLPFAGVFTIAMLIAYNMNSWAAKIDFEQRYGSIRNSDYYFPDRNYGKITTDRACELNIYCIEKHR